MQYLFGPWRLDTQRQKFYRHDESVPMRPKVTTRLISKKPGNCFVANFCSTKAKLTEAIARGPCLTHLRGQYKVAQPPICHSRVA